MNKALLNKEVQDFVEKHYKADVSKIVLKGSPFPEVSPQELAVQLIGRRKAEKKLPTWFKTRNILYPPTLNLEQTSSEVTAAHKASLIGGKSIIDITGGFGIDSYFFSERFAKVVHCELNGELSQLVKHNSQVLGVQNLETVPGDGISLLQNAEEKFDWIYVDPSRRDDGGGRVFHLSDCLPNVPQNLELFWEKSDKILIKTSPLLDLKAGLLELQGVKEIHIVAVENDVKELLWVLEKGFSEEIQIKTVNFGKNEKQVYETSFGKPAEINYAMPGKYLYEPNAAIRKSGSFEPLSETFQLFKLHPNSHLFTSEEPKNFPGRSFRIREILPFKKKTIHNALKAGKANITTRNFPESVENLRKKLKIKEGGNQYLFFTTLENEEKVVLLCEKL